MEYTFSVYIEAHDHRPDAADRIQVEIARHLAVTFGTMFKGVAPNGHVFRQENTPRPD